MKHQIATTKDQSLRLYAAGVDECTADMVWTAWDNDDEYIEQLSVMDESAYEASCLNPYPAWSLSRLMALLPESLVSPTGVYYWLEFSKVRMHNQWEVQWFHYNHRWCTRDEDGKHVPLWAESPIEACVKAIEWLLSNNYKLNVLG